MDKYENLGTIGEGSYGVVLKCKDKTNGLTVAIKKFLDTDNEKTVKKIATREIKILKVFQDFLTILCHNVLINKKIYFKTKIDTSP